MSPDPDEISSLDFACGSFAPHGEFRARYDDGVLHWVNRGPFNVEALRQYGQARQAALARWQLADCPFVGLVEWRDSMLMSAEAFATYAEGFERFCAGPHRLQAVAWVARPGLEGLDIMQRHFGRLFQLHALPFRLFEAVEPARGWVLTCLAEARQGPAAPAA